jgi:hypothetical protein
MTLWASGPKARDKHLTSLTHDLLTRMDWNSRDAHDMTVEDVAKILISNQIPVSWIDHAYTYGLHFLNHHMDGSATAHSGQTLHRQSECMRSTVSHRRMGWLVCANH